LKSKFTTCFKNSEYVFVSDVYGAGEKKPKNFDLNKFISNIAKNSKVKAEYFVKNDQLFELTKKNRSKIIFLFLGAGTVTDWAQNFAKELKKIYE
jgi:UDP-N-acetylmuramate-alanine ligase